MAGAANHTFLSWVQPNGAATFLNQAKDTLGANQPAVVALPVQLVVNTDSVNKTVRLYGPGDVTAIDPQQVVRVEPQPRTTNFEPNYFPGIEFGHPAYPWLFTPATAGAQERLRPWLCLLVMPEGKPGVEFRPSSGQALPVLVIQDPASPAVELPDLAESHFWAHAQITGSDKSQVKATLQNDPERSVSRLLCPRRLDPFTKYIACVVPAFAVGVKAGLGLPIQPTDEAKLDPAWLSGDHAPAEITLPVYYSWEFQTGAGGDFEELARQLRPHELPPEVGKRPMDISHPGFVLQPAPQPNAPGTTLGLEGALRAVGSKSDVWPDPVRVPFQMALEKILNLPWELATTHGTDQDPVLAPPIYGSWHAARHQVSIGAAPPIWLDELNLDPRNRVAAAMGTQVIQNQQEQLMASAWDQLGEIQSINQRLRQAQLSRAVNNIYHAKSFSRFSDESFFKIVAPAQSRLVLEILTPGTSPVKMLLIQKLAESPVPLSAVSGPIRRISRSRGAINRRFSQAGTTGIKAVLSLFNSGEFTTTTGSTGPENGSVTIDQVSDGLLKVIQSAGGFYWNPDPVGHWERPSVDFINTLTTDFRLSNLSSSQIDEKKTPLIPANLITAAEAHQDFLHQAFATSIAFAPPIALSTADVRTAALDSLDPNKTVPAAVLPGLMIGSPPLQSGDPLDPIMDTPTFPQPMYEALRDLSQDTLLPGLEKVPANTVQLLQTNPMSVESIMVGLNTAMSAELLWRGYPTDQRGTYFQRFWDAPAGAQPDIPPIKQWTHALGGNSTGAAAAGASVVLLIRGELLRRYPNTVIYAVKAVQNGASRDLSTKPADERHPLFRGTLEPDVTFVGFNLTPAEVIADPGWYFVLQQQPTEPRFGLDDVTFAADGSEVIPELKTWDDLNWAHLAPSAEALKQLSYVAVSKVQLTPTQPTKGIWGRNSAHMAYITRQQPVRVAIHATELLP